MTYTYKPKGVCSRAITVTLDGDTVENVEFKGGCPGNTTGVSPVSYTHLFGLAILCFHRYYISCGNLLCLHPYFRVPASAQCFYRPGVRGKSKGHATCGVPFFFEKVVDFWCKLLVR